MTNLSTVILNYTELRYFTVVWCKISAKKHKDWKEDAILIVKQRSVTLKVI